jgi:opacity protein-like surface antigen
MKILAALTAAALLAPAAARAQPVSSLSGPGPDTYLELQLGAFLPQHDDLDALDPGYAVAATFGARFTPNLGVEGGVEYVRATGQDQGVRLELTDVPISASVRFRLPMKVAELSAIAGAALHFAHLSSERDVGVFGFQESSDTSTAFGFHVGAAAAFNLSSTMLFGVDVRRTFVAPEFDDVDVRLDALRLALTLTYHF